MVLVDLWQRRLRASRQRLKSHAAPRHPPIRRHNVSRPRYAHSAYWSIAYGEARVAAAAIGICHPQPKQPRSGVGIRPWRGQKRRRYAALYYGIGVPQSFVPDGFDRVEVGGLAGGIPTEEYTGDGADGKRQHHGISLDVDGPVGEDGDQP